MRRRNLFAAASLRGLLLSVAAAGALLSAGMRGTVHPR